MSISEAVKAWLAGFEGLEILSDRLAADAEAAGLFRAPDTTETVFVDGSRDVTAYFTFAVRRGSQTDDLREDNEDWLEGLERRVRTKNLSRDLPETGDGRTIYAVSVSGTYNMDDQTDADTTWSVTLAVSYYEQGE